VYVELNRKPPRREQLVTMTREDDEETSAEPKPAAGNDNLHNAPKKKILRRMREQDLAKQGAQSGYHAKLDTKNMWSSFITKKEGRWFMTPNHKGTYNFNAETKQLTVTDENRPNALSHDKRKSMSTVVVAQARVTYQDFQTHFNQTGTVSLANLKNPSSSRNRHPCCIVANRKLTGIILYAMA
jgi:hypothetical protein